MSYLQPSGFLPLYPCGYNTQSGMVYNGCSLKVEGRGSIKVQPDMATIILGVATENTQLSVAQEENAKITTEIINTLMSMGISSKDIETQSYTIDPQYDYVEGKQVFRGYRVVHTLKITVRDVNKIGRIIDQAVASGANIVNSISFTVQDPSKYYQQALNAAIDDVLAKAMTVGNKLRVCVSQIPVQIVETGYQCTSPINATLLKAPAGTTPIQTGQIEITAQIEATFTYFCNK